MRIDLNADVGEHDDAKTTVLERSLLATVTSVNVACGFHAGGPDVMRRTLALARELGVAAGAHPGYRDVEGFGRRDQPIVPRSIENLVAYQVGALQALARAEGVAITHVKPHGALYNQAARDEDVAAAVAAAVRHVDPALRLVALAGSRLAEAGAAAGLRVVAEGFVDRGYRADGTLVPRDAPGALVTDPASAARRAIALARDGRIPTEGGGHLEVRVETLCVHGDTPGALAIARAARAALEEAGLVVAAPVR
jgi:UPF0271 protein